MVAVLGTREKNIYIEREREREIEISAHERY